MDSAFSSEDENLRLLNKISALEEENSNLKKEVLSWKENYKTLRPHSNSIKGHGRYDCSIYELRSRIDELERYIDGQEDVIRIKGDQNFILEKDLEGKDKLIRELNGLVSQLQRQNSDPRTQHVEHLMHSLEKSNERNLVLTELLQEKDAENARLCQLIEGGVYPVIPPSSSNLPSDFGTFPPLPSSYFVNEDEENDEEENDEEKLAKLLENSREVRKKVDKNM